MNAPAAPTPIASDDNILTFTREAWEAYLSRVEDLADTVAVQRHDTWVSQVGPDEARRLSFTGEETARLIDGESAIAILRGRMGLGQRQLATLAGVSPSYLAEIEGRRKPGSAAALRKLAEALRVPMETLID